MHRGRLSRLPVPVDEEWAGALLHPAPILRVPNLLPISGRAKKRAARSGATAATAEAGKKVAACPDAKTDRRALDRALAGPEGKGRASLDAVTRRRDSRALLQQRFAF